MIVQETRRQGCRLLHQQEAIDGELLRFKQESRPEAAGLPRDIAEILRFIHENLFDPLLNVQAVKRGCACRNNNVTTRFRSIVGVGIRERIEALRLEAACTLLAHTRGEVYLIAMAVGYEHQETFCRAFLRRFGRTPSEQRLFSRAAGGALIGERLDQERSSIENESWLLQ